MIEKTTYYDSYVCDGEQTEFPITFDVLLDDDGNATGVTVTVQEQDETPDELDEYDYSIEGLNVVTPQAWPLNTRLVISRKNEITQATDFVKAGTVEPDTFERAMDKITCILQELKHGLSRCLKLPVTSSVSAEEISMDDLTSAVALAEASAAAAKKWASEVEGSAVETGKYSALHYAAKAQERLDAIASLISEATGLYSALIETDVAEKTILFADLSIPNGNYRAYVQLLGNNCRYIEKVTVECTTAGVTIRIYNNDTDSYVAEDGPPAIKWGIKKWGAAKWGELETISMNLFLREVA